MRSAKDISGELRFSCEEWRTAKQINSFFSRYAAAKRKEQANSVDKAVTLDEIDDEDESEDVDVEKQDLFCEMQHAVYEEIDLRHPIVFAGYNICSLVKEGKLTKKFKVDELKELCNSF